jgi:hypothetical protein
MNAWLPEFFNVLNPFYMPPQNSPNSKAGTQAISKVLFFFVAIGMAFDKTFRDSKFSWDDIFNFLPAQAEAPKTKQEWEAAWAELRDLDEAEKDQLISQIQERLQLSKTETEILIEDTAEIGFDFYVYLNKHFINRSQAA